MSERILSYPTVAFDESLPALRILDQTLLPQELVMLSLQTPEELFEAIYRLRVRGAPAIGVAAAYGIYLAALRVEAEDPQGFRAGFAKQQAYLASARPTAVNLSWALNRMASVLDKYPEADKNSLCPQLLAEAKAIHAEDTAMCRQIGLHGLTLLKDGDGILTHCNAGQLATSKYGTALAPLHLGVEQGMQFRVFTDETRPLLQGARLSAFELSAHGIDTTLICDNMASSVMQRGWVQAVLVGADRIAANGDVANKIGTSGVAILAQYYGIPVYVLAPTSTIDMGMASGAEIPIEERPAEEVTHLWYEKPVAPQGVGVYNPAFDVSDHRLIAAIVTEKGIARAPYTESLRAMMD